MCNTQKFFVFEPTQQGWRTSKSIEQIPSWEANSSSASQEIPRILWNLTVHYRVHKSPPPVHNLRQINPIYASPFRFLEIYFNIILSSTPSYSSWFYPLNINCSWQHCEQTRNTLHWFVQRGIICYLIFRLAGSDICCYRHFSSCRHGDCFCIHRT